MTAKLSKTPETAKFSIENGRLCRNGKCYNECNYDEKQSFNECLKDEGDERLLSMLERATKPLIRQFVPEITSTGLYKSVPHFV